MIKKLWEWMNSDFALGVMVLIMVGLLIWMVEAR